MIVRNSAGYYSGEMAHVRVVFDALNHESQCAWELAVKFKDVFISKRSSRPPTFVLNALDVFDEKESLRPVLLTCWTFQTSLFPLQCGTLCESTPPSSFNVSALNLCCTMYQNCKRKAC